jgi:hypothetical protein
MRAEIGERGVIHGGAEEVSISFSSRSIVRAKGEIAGLGGEDRVFKSQGVCPITGPSVLAWIGKHACAYRVELDVALAQEQVGLGLHERGLVPTVPKCAGSPVGVIDILDVSPPHRETIKRGTEVVCSGVSSR